jgi:L-histidine N-alpha-methyltransferase
MNRGEQSMLRAAQPLCLQVLPSRQIPDVLDDVRNGLLRPPRSLPPKYFYDERGSRLFDRICETDEYYPTRTEDALLARYGAQIIQQTRPAQIVELGSGTSRKTRRLLDACETHTHTCSYAPFDVCGEMVHQVAVDLQNNYPWLEVVPLVGDYHAGLGNIPIAEGVNMFMFLGSTIGNFTPAETRDFINEVRDCMRPGDYFLLGADRVKDERILNAAYNDAEGLTARFNLNVLQVLNREIDANFNTENFSHLALFNRDLNRIEMYLVSEIDQIIRFRKPGFSISLQEGEKILTEISRKFTRRELEAMILQSGLEISQHFEPENKYFSLVLSRLP